MDYEEMAKTREDQVNAQKCDELDDELTEISLALEEIKRKFKAIDGDALDAEGHEFWDSGMVEQFINEIDTAIDALEGQF